MEKRLEELVERGVQALEALAKDPVVEIEAGPPVCPACGVFNPEISINETNSKGPLFEYVLIPVCNSCNTRFYAVPQTWHMFMRREEVQAQMEERRGNGSSGS